MSWNIPGWDLTLWVPLLQTQTSTRFPLNEANPYKLINFKSVHCIFHIKLHAFPLLVLYSLLSLTLFG